MRGRAWTSCDAAPAARPAKGAIPARAAKLAMPVAPSISRLVKKGRDAALWLIGDESAMSACVLAMIVSVSAPSGQRKLAREGPRIKGKVAIRRGDGTGCFRVDRGAGGLGRCRARPGRRPRLN